VIVVEPAAGAAGVVVVWCQIALAAGERSVLHCSGIRERMGLKLFGRAIIFEEFQPM